MKIDIHSHFFPIDAFQNSDKFQDHAPKITQENGQYSVVAGGGSRGNLQEGAYAAEARMRELDKLGSTSKRFRRHQSSYTTGKRPMSQLISRVCKMEPSRQS